MCLFSHIIQFLSIEYANTKTHTQHLFKVNSAGKFLIKKNKNPNVFYDENDYKIYSTDL